MTLILRGLASDLRAMKIRLCSYTLYAMIALTANF